ncbi:glycoside hydrolase family 5 protein [Leifsonia shinshuensis]|uniref:glycoside hydrolase family 5 protein n=1 Tax=Leifsonia shinshuensis TaxID=150026 RepID=UPI001F506C69|nr:cellulase family glycosylhydrolase [Leifsonia shinshuensis]MCI0158382.1 glycoside hydrolase family 5 protein [Leifsonia shinshuensis]
MSTLARRTAVHEGLRKTLNIGLDLGADAERGWTVIATRELFARCADAGFTGVRLVVSLAAHRDGDRLDAEALEGIRSAVETAEDTGLGIAVANQLDPDLMRDPAGQRDRALVGVRSLAGLIADAGPTVALEPLAEPSGALDANWNELLADVIRVCRSEDPERTLLVGPAGYNNARFLERLRLPAGEENVIVDLHQYWPIRFTMQGETWLGSTELGDPASWIGTTWEGDAQQRGELEAGYGAVAGFAATTGLPVFIGEFGTTNNADAASRSRWTAFNRELAEQHGFAWGYWSYGPSFGLVDPSTGEWDADLLHALLPR